MAQKSKSEMARLITKEVVACSLSFLSLVRATTVRRLPVTPSRHKMMADVAANRVNDCENSITALGGECVGLAVLEMRLVSSSIWLQGSPGHY